MEERLTSGKSERENDVVENDVIEGILLLIKKVRAPHKSQERASNIKSNFDLQLWLRFAIIYQFCIFIYFRGIFFYYLYFITSN